MTMMALSSSGTGISLFRRKERHDLYGRTSMRNDMDDYDDNLATKNMRIKRCLTTPITSLKS